MRLFAIGCCAILLLVSCGGSPRNTGYFSRTPPPPSAAPWELKSEKYDRIIENTFLDVLENPLSTFSIDVDAASYSNVRRFLNDGQLPPPDAVRVEEMINYFDYDYPQPGDSHPFSITTEVSECPWNQSHRLVHVGLQGEEFSTEEAPPSNLVFLIDVSGSMDWPNKLGLLKSSFKMLVNNLRDDDRVAIVVYAGAAGVVLPSTKGKDKAKIIEALDRLQAGGSTAGGAGILLAYYIAQDNFKKNGNNRVILATDGDFNVGISGDVALVSLIEEKRKSGIYLSVLSVGTGNLKDSKMEKLADHGNGNYYYIDNMLEARRVLVEQMTSTLYTIANDVKIQVEFNPSKVRAYRLVGYENRLLEARDFKDDTKDAGELGAGHTVTALYEIIPRQSGDEAVLEENSLYYRETVLRDGPHLEHELMTIMLRYKLPGGEESKLIVRPVLDRQVELAGTSDDFRFSAAVAEFGMLLRSSKFKGESSYAQALQTARGAVGDDISGYRGEFVRLLEVAESLHGAELSTR